MKVYVINKYGEPLMPCSPRKARLLLRDKKATVVSREPFTIKLTYGGSGYKQKISIGVDTGHSFIGVSVLTEAQELNSYEFKLRNDISEKLTQRKQYRRTRRGRLRYRKPRFNNRSASTRKGRLAPSVQWKVDAHKRVIDMLCCRLPACTLIIETAKFDIQKIENPNISNQQYQQGVQYGFENVKAYVLHRDNYKCQAGKSGCSNKLHIHHIQFRSNGGTDKPSNLITLCEKHHDQLHKGKLKNNFTPTSKKRKAETVMSIIRKRLLSHYPKAIETFGYVTKKNRYTLGIDKSHANDAFVIAGGTTQNQTETQMWSFKRGNSRQLQRNRKGFKPAIRRQRYSIQPKDIVEFEGKRYEVNSMHSKGRRCIIWIGDKKSSKKIEDLKLIYNKKNLFTMTCESRRIPPIQDKVMNGFPALKML